MPPPNVPLGLGQPAAPSDEPPPPSFYALIASHSLVPALRPALVRTLRVAADHYPHVGAVYDLGRCAEGAVCVALAGIETWFLSSTAGTAAEGFYGLRRRRAPTTSHGASPRPPPAPASPPLSSRDVATSVFCTVILPYLVARLDDWHAAGVVVNPRPPPANISDDPPAPTGAPAADTDAVGDNQTHSPPASLFFDPCADAADLALSLLPPARRRNLLARLRTVYPFLRASLSLTEVAFKIAYLTGRGRYFSPYLWSQGLVLGTVTADDERARAQRMVRTAVQSLRAHHGDRSIVSLLARTAAWARFQAHAHAHSMLPAALLALRLVSWWMAPDASTPGVHDGSGLPAAGGAGASTAASAAVVPPPPPAPAAIVDPCGDSLPHAPARGSAAGACPICGGARRNPCVLAPSGFAFCFACVFDAVTDKGQCPVTGIPATTAQIRRIFEDEDEA
jgi:peroxin-12